MAELPIELVRRAHVAGPAIATGSVPASAGMALSIDVEDWFHSECVKSGVPRDSWSGCLSRVERNTMRILDVLDGKGVRATFFVLGWVAERFPGLVRAIAGAGHEIASHGYGHELVYEISPAKFRADVARARGLLEDIAAVPVRGYRAPCFSITDAAIDILQEEGYSYDSSAVPTLAHDRYGGLAGMDDRQPIVLLREGFHEVCVSCLPLGRRGIPWGGGGYFRLLPYRVWLHGVMAIRRAGLPYVFYIHPWEIDPGHPVPPGISLANRIRYRINLDRCEAKFAALVGEFHWEPIGDLLDHWRARPPASAAGAVVSCT